MSRGDAGQRSANYSAMNSGMLSTSRNEPWTEKAPQRLVLDHLFEYGCDPRFWIRFSGWENRSQRSSPLTAYYR